MIDHTDGSVHFRIFLPRAERVELVGDFTEWEHQAIPMRSNEDGWWEAQIEVKPGDHEFSYHVDGHSWIADFAANGVKRNAFGGWVSLLTVDSGARAAA